MNIFTLKNKTVLIGNGYDHNTYFPSKYKRLKFRKKNKIKNSDIILGYAGRYAKQKIFHQYYMLFLN